MFKFLHPSSLTAAAQVILSLVFIIGYFWVLNKVLSGDIKVIEGYTEVVSALLGVVTGSVVTIVAFWFSRSRETKVVSDSTSEDSAK